MLPFTIVHLSGPQRGATWLLLGDTMHVVAGRYGLLPYATTAHAADGDVLFTLRRTARGHEIAEPPGRPVWAAGARARSYAVASGDLIEVGNGGPVLRYRRATDLRGHKSVSDAARDVLDGARIGGRSLFGRAEFLGLAAARQIATQITPAVRLACVLGMLVLGAGLIGLSDADLRRQPEPGRPIERPEALAPLLRSPEPATFDRDDFEAARQELDFRIDEALTQADALEDRTTTRTQLITSVAHAVVFLQGSYGFIDADSGRPLRRGPGQHGEQTLMAGGAGPDLELRYTSTGFLVGTDGLLVTSRRAAVPWESNEGARALTQLGYTPVLRHLVGYLPGARAPVEINPLETHEDADLALLRCRSNTLTGPGLALAKRAPETGENIIVLAYPTTMRALLARAGDAFVRQEIGPRTIDFWELGARLAARAQIAPLATAGRVAEVTSGSVLYVTETAHGGSGGPVLRLDGSVVAVSAAMLPRRSGESNLGIPAAFASELIQRQAAAR